MLTVEEWGVSFSPYKKFWSLDSVENKPERKELAPDHLQCASYQRCDGTSGHFRDEACGMGFRCDDAVGVDLGNTPEEVLPPVFIGEIADQGENHQSDDCSTGSHVLDSKMFLSPSLAYLFEGNKDDNGSDANATRCCSLISMHFFSVKFSANSGTKSTRSEEIHTSIPVWKSLQYVTDLIEHSTGYIRETD